MGGLGGVPKSKKRNLPQGAKPPRDGGSGGGSQNPQNLPLGAKPPRKGCFFEKYEPPEAAPPQEIVLILIKGGHFIIKGCIFYKKGVFSDFSEPPEATGHTSKKLVGKVTYIIYHGILINKTWPY